MGLDRIGWDGMGSYLALTPATIFSDTCRHLPWQVLGPSMDGMGWGGMGLGLIGFDWVSLGWVKLGWTGLD